MTWTLDPTLQGCTLEILPRTGGDDWLKVTEYIFRSWSGERRVNRQPHSGPVFFLGTDKVSSVPCYEDGEGWLWCFDCHDQEPAERALTSAAPEKRCSGCRRDLKDTLKSQ